MSAPVAGCPIRILFTNWECGGHVDPALILALRCRERGHDVLFASDAADAEAAGSLGVPFVAWSAAPSRRHIGDQDDSLTEWRARTPLGKIDTICREVVVTPAGAYAADTCDLIHRFEPDLVVSNELLFGCIAAAESCGVACALITGNIWCFPTRSDVPPFGPGFRRLDSGYGPGRDRWTRRFVTWAFNRRLSTLNRVRLDLGLAPLASLLDQLDYPASILLGVSRRFDIGEREPPDRFFYCGPLIRIPAWVDAASQTVGWGDADPRPRVLVSFSTTPQGQRTVLSNCIRALGAMPVSAIVTLGPAVDGRDLPSAANVAILRSASHDRLMPGCAAMVCHGGHGTVIRPLMNGVPVLCLPMGRDQADNSARIVEHGAGLRLSPAAGPRRIRRALTRLLADPSYRANAERLGDAVRAEADEGARAAAHLETLKTLTTAG